MSFSNVTILTRKLESLPEEYREKFAKYISEHLEDFEDEMRWDESFKRTSAKLSEMARNARNEIEKGQAESMDFERL